MKTHSITAPETTVARYRAIKAIIAFGLIVFTLFNIDQVLGKAPSSASLLGDKVNGKKNAASAAAKEKPKFFVRMGREKDSSNGWLPGDTTFDGEGEPGTMVILSANGKKIGKAPVMKDRSWTMPGTIDELGPVKFIAKFFKGKKLVHQTNPVIFNFVAELDDAPIVGDDSFGTPAPGVAATGGNAESVPVPNVAPTLTESGKDKPVSMRSLTKEAPPSTSTATISEKAIAEKAPAKPLTNAKLKAPAGASLPFVISSHADWNTIPSGIHKVGGKGKAGDKVLVSVDNLPVAKLTIKADGRWYAMVPLRKPGKRTVSAKLLASGTKKEVRLNIK